MGRSRKSKRQRHSSQHLVQQQNGNEPMTHEERQGSVFSPLNHFFNRSRNYSSPSSQVRIMKQADKRKEREREKKWIVK